MGYCSWAKKQSNVYGTGWSMNGTQFLQILASQTRYSICWRCSNIANPQHYETETTISSSSGYQFSHCDSLAGQKARQNTKLPCKFRTWPATEVNETRYAKVKDTLNEVKVHHVNPIKKTSTPCQSKYSLNEAPIFIEWRYIEWSFFEISYIRLTKPQSPLCSLKAVHTPVGNRSVENLHPSFYKFFFY